MLEVELVVSLIFESVEKAQTGDDYCIVLVVTVLVYRSKELRRWYGEIESTT